MVIYGIALAVATVLCMRYSVLFLLLAGCGGASFTEASAAVLGAEDSGPDVVVQKLPTALPDAAQEAADPPPDPSPEADPPEAGREAATDPPDAAPDVDAGAPDAAPETDPPDSAPDALATCQRTCSGCCDDTGKCQVGLTWQACGANGAACVRCEREYTWSGGDAFLSSACMAGVCGDLPDAAPVCLTGSCGCPSATSVSCCTTTYACGCQLISGGTCN